MLRHLFFILIANSLLANPLEVKISAPSAILINGDSGRILFEKNAHDKRFPASLTKIATCIYTLKKGRHQLDSDIAAEQDCIGAVSESAKRKSGYKNHPPHWLVFDCCHIGIKKGEILSLKDLIFAMMVASADDASNIIAHHIEGTVPKFMEKLNEELSSWGCQNTKFLNPHGLHHPDHKTTAYDMALMTKEGMKDPLFREIVSTVTYTRPKTNKQEAVPLTQTNRFLRKGKHRYEPVIGVKTGHTSDAGYCLSSAARKNGRYLISVIMGASELKQVYEDSKTLFETAFSEQKVVKTLYAQGEQKLFLNNEKRGKIHTKLQEPLQVSFYPSENHQFHVKAHWIPLNEDPKVNDPIGELRVYNDNDELVTTAPLLISSIEPKKWDQKWYYGMVLLVVAAGLFSRKRATI